MIKHIAPFLIAMLLAIPVAHADGWHEHGRDHDRARDAVQSGQVLPLETVLAAMRRDFPGDVIEAELDDWHGRPVYEIKLISPDGNVQKLMYDARDGTLLRAKGRGAGHGDGGGGWR